MKKDEMIEYCEIRDNNVFVTFFHIFINNTIILTQEE